MSTIAHVAWALEARGIEPVDKLALICVAASANMDGQCFPPWDAIARRADLTQDGLRLAVARLSVIGLAGFGEAVNPASGERQACIVLLREG